MGIVISHPDELNRQIAAGLLTVIKEERDNSGALKRVKVESSRYVKSDTALIGEVLRDIGGKKNLLVMNDEAHHAYRIRRDEPEEELEEDMFGEEEEAAEFFKEATVWVDGLDKVQKLRGINLLRRLLSHALFSRTSRGRQQIDRFHGS